MLSKNTAADLTPAEVEPFVGGQIYLDANGPELRADISGLRLENGVITFQLARIEKKYDCAWFRQIEHDGALVLGLYFVSNTPDTRITIVNHPARLDEPRCIRLLMQHDKYARKAAAAA